jgi:anaerobic selenocysteine-containing dehydrogenase
LAEPRPAKNFLPFSSRIFFRPPAAKASASSQLASRNTFNYIHNPLRLTKPLIRRDGVAKTTELLDPNDLDTVFREASWDEALAFAAGGLKKMRSYVRREITPNTQRGSGLRQRNIQDVPECLS